MGGGLMQLVAYGAQDVYLTGNPQITFFKVVYRRHTNFAMESIEQTFNGSADFGKKVTCTISRNGDLIHSMYLQTDLPAITVGNTAYFRWADKPGHALIKNVEVEIGGQKIDKHYGDWLNIWSELTLPRGKERAFNHMIGEDVSRGSGGQDTALNNVSNDFRIGSDVSIKRLNVPLQFWFNRNPGLALPLIALQYHEVKVNFEFRDIAGMGALDSGRSNTTLTSSSGSLTNTSLWVDYIYLDTDERRRFAQVSHEYLIEQLQFTGEESVTTTSKTATLNFNHPVKELVWVVQDDRVLAANQYNNYGTRMSGFSNRDDGSYKAGAAHDVVYGVDRSVNPVSKAKLQLNGHDRFAERDGDYFNYVQPYQHHTRSPRVGINVYSFALKPEEHQPSGTCNFSRIDNAQLQLTLQAGNSFASVSGKLRVYAVNYNVLRIMSGMGGLAYSN